mmetsp:Transcript_43746/g.138268  ORF Transcript_43746/g.138268 Transcript_43746/m.138268 type:complete len:98 (+) Transcript_43746:137-430(+)
MRFVPDQEAALRARLIDQLSTLSEAEPPVLAEYVIALLKNDVALDDLKKTCNDELHDFLQDNTPLFVDKLFEDLQDWSWMSGAKKTSFSNYSAGPSP